MEPAPALLAGLVSMDRPARSGLRWTRPDQWHVTLRFFAAVDAADLVSALSDLPPLDAVVARAGPRPYAMSEHVWALPVAGLDSLAAAVLVATSHLGVPERRRFRGHLTLARARQPRALSGLATPEVSTEWPVTEVVAVSSELRPDGARYRVLARQAL